MILRLPRSRMIDLIFSLDVAHGDDRDDDLLEHGPTVDEPRPAGEMKFTITAQYAIPKGLSFHPPFLLRAQLPLRLVSTFRVETYSLRCSACLHSRDWISAFRTEDAERPRIAFPRRTVGTRNPLSTKADRNVCLTKHSRPSTLDPPLPSLFPPLIFLAGGFQRAALFGR